MFNSKLDFDAFKKPLKKVRNLDFKDVRMKDLMHNIDMRELGSMLNPSLIAKILHNRTARRYAVGGVVVIAAAAALTKVLRDRAENRREPDTTLVPQEQNGRTVYSIAPKKTA